jgi:hypothetical protein
MYGTKLSKSSWRHSSTARQARDHGPETRRAHCEAAGCPTPPDVVVAVERTNDHDAPDDVTDQLASHALAKLNAKRSFVCPFYRCSRTHRAGIAPARHVSDSRRRWPQVHCDVAASTNAWCRCGYREICLRQSEHLLYRVHISKIKPRDFLQQRGLQF